MFSLGSDKCSTPLLHTFYKVIQFFLRYTGTGSKRVGSLKVTILSHTLIGCMSNNLEGIYWIKILADSSLKIADFGHWMGH